MERNDRSSEVQRGHPRQGSAAGTNVSYVKDNEKVSATGPGFQCVCTD